MVGWGLAKTIRMAVPREVIDPEILQNVRQEMLDEYRRNPVVDSVPYPGVTDLLDELEEMEFPVAIISNKEDPITQQVVWRIFGNYPFVGVIGSSTKFPPKPNTAGAEYLLKKVGFPADRVLFVGDTAMDMETARLVGACPVGVSWGYRDPEELVEAGAYRIIDSVGEVFDLLRGKLAEGKL